MDRFFKDSDGHIVIAQWPNLPICGWFVSSILSFAIKAKPWHSGFDQLSSAFLFAWAYLEIRHGASPFRRVLGAVVIIVVIYGFFTT